MSKYDNAVDLSDLKFALEGFDARLSAIEAAQKKPDAPTPEQREPGWYLFWYDGNPYPWEWCGRRWRSLTGALVSKHEGEEFAQRIQPPKGAA